MPSALSGLGLGLAVHVGFLAVSIVDSAWVREMPSDLAYELAYELAVWGIWLTAGGLIIGLVFGLLAGLGGKLDHITPRETLRWSWREAWRKVQEQQMPRWTLGILVLFIGPFGLLIGLESGLRTGLGFVLSTFLSASGIIFLIPGLMFGFTAGQINFRTIPNEGIRRSLRNALISFLAALLLVVLVVVLITVGAHLLLNWSLNLSQRQLLSLTLPVALYNGLVTGLYCGVVKALRNGGFACLQHYTLRLMFWGSGYTPRNYIQFLDYAVERIFLRSVGGGYIFTHRLLMEYFATLQPADEATRLHSV